MSKYVDHTNSCNHQSSSIVNLLSDENYGDETHPSVSFIKDSDETATFCVLCRSLSNPSSVNGEWDNSFSECNDHVLNSVYQGDIQRHLLINASDGADIPLLSNGDGYGTNAISLEETDHCHTAPPPPRNGSATQQLVAALFMCLVFMMAEVVGGYLAGSLAIMTDAAHLASDFAGFLVSLFAIRLGRRPPNTLLSFGYYRAEVLGALLSISIIWVLTGVITYLAVHRIINQDFEIKADTMMIVAAIGIVVNIVMGLVLHGVCHGISHSHSHGGGLSHSHASDSTMDMLAEDRQHQHAPKKQKNINVRAAVIHVVGDLIQSIGVFVAAVVIKIFPDADLVDPWCTLVFAVIALATSLPVLRDSVLVLMEAVPRSHDYNTVASSLMSVEGVEGVHDLHVWSLTVDNNRLAVHLAIDVAADPELVLKRALQLVRRKFDIMDATIQIEKYSADSMQHCAQCQPLKDR